MVAVDPQALQLRNVSASATFFLPDETRYATRVSLARKATIDGDVSWATSFDHQVFRQSGYTKYTLYRNGHGSQNGDGSVSRFEQVLLGRARMALAGVPTDLLRAFVGRGDADDLGSVPVVEPGAADAQYPSSEVDTIYDAVRDGHVSAAAVIAAARAFETGQLRG